jgi:tetratricopeptide (TPR) repeat protein
MLAEARSVAWRRRVAVPRDGLRCAAAMENRSPSPDVTRIADALDAFGSTSGGQGINYSDLVSRFGEEGAVVFYDGLAARYRSLDGGENRELTALALYSKGIALFALGRSEEAIAAYDELIDSYGVNAEPAVRNLLAKAAFNKAGTLSEMGRDEESIRGLR